MDLVALLRSVMPIIVAALFGTERDSRRHPGGLRSGVLEYAQAVVLTPIVLFAHVVPRPLSARIDRKAHPRQTGCVDRYSKPFTRSRPNAAIDIASNNWPSRTIASNAASGNVPVIMSCSVTSRCVSP